jgi:2-methylcitrate dehydratase PrpD
MNVCETLIENILTTRFEIFSPEIVACAKNRIIDIIGCLIAGANLPPSPSMVDMVQEWGGKEESTILVYGVKAPAHNVGMVNTIMSRLLDFEPVGPVVKGKRNMVHLSASTVPTAFAVAEQTGAGGKELITALILGDDLASRIITASDYTIDSGWEAMGIVPPFGTAAIAGRLRGFGKEQMLNTFGIVLNQLAGTVQNVYEGTHAFVLPQGLASRDGIFSAELAGRGFTGVKNALTGKFGFFDLYCKTYSPEVLTQDLGREFYSDSILKKYPSCGGNHAAISCALELANRYDIIIDEIDRIILGVSHETYASFLGQPFEITPFPPATARFNLRYNVANALLRKSVKLEHFTEDYIRDKKLYELTKRIDLTVLPPSGNIIANLDIRMKDDRIFSQNTDTIKGSPNNPLSDEEIRDKFRSNVAFSNTVTGKNAEKVLDLLEHLEEVDDIIQIISLLVA